MRRTIPAAVAIVAFAALSGCRGAQPSRYYLLEAPVSPPAAAANPYPVTLMVGHISAPDLLRDDRLVFRTGPLQLGTYEYQRWAERPTEMIEAILERDLRNSGRFHTVERWGSSVAGDFLLRGRLSRLEEVDNGKSISTSVELELELYDPKIRTAVWNQTYSHDEPAAGKTVPDVVQSLNHNLQQGMEQLTAGLFQYFAEHPPK